MLQLTPILFAIASALVMYQISIWRTARALDANSSPLVDRRLWPVLGRLARALELSTLDLHIYEITPINGLAAPDGRIFITRGLYERFRTGGISAEELASVVAHEVGHVALGHAKRRQMDFSGQNAIRVALAAVLGRYVPGFGMLIATALANLLAARLSRQDEFEADAYAAALMVKAGIGIGPQVRLLEKLQGMAGIGGGAPVWLMSHPRTRDRIAAIRALERGWQAAGR